MYIVRTRFGLCLKMQVGDYEISTVFDEERELICSSDHIKVFTMGGPEVGEVTSKIFKEEVAFANEDNLLKVIKWCKRNTNKRRRENDKAS